MLLTLAINYFAIKVEQAQKIKSRGNINNQSVTLNSKITCRGI